MENACDGLLGRVVPAGDGIQLQRVLEGAESELAGRVGYLSLADQSPGAAGSDAGVDVELAVVVAGVAHVGDVGGRIGVFAFVVEEKRSMRCLVLDVSDALERIDGG